MRAPLVVDGVGFVVVYALLLGPAAAGAGLGCIYGALVAGMAVVAILQLLLVARGRWATVR